MAKAFQSLIRDKRVLLLGPAKHILIPENTEDFRDFEVVVKLNKMVEKSSFLDEDLNNRNDILYHCLQVDIPNGDMPYSLEEWKRRGVRHVRIPFSGTTLHYRMNINRFLQKNKNLGLEFSICPTREFEDLNVLCNNTLPSTGIAAINDLLLRSPSELCIRGLTFMETPYCEEYKNEKWHKNTKNRKKTTKHDPNKQLEYFKKLYLNNNITLDRELYDIVARIKK